MRKTTQPCQQQGKPQPIFLIGNQIFFSSVMIFLCLSLTLLRASMECFLGFASRVHAGLGDGVSEQAEFRRQHGVESWQILRINRNQALAFLLIEHLFFVHAHFVLRRVHAPVFDIDIQFRQIKIGTDLELADDPEFGIITIS